MTSTYRVACSLCDAHGTVERPDSRGGRALPDGWRLEHGKPVCPAHRPARRA